MLSEREHDDIVARLYASALGDTPWAPLLEHVAGQFNAQASLVQISDRRSWPVYVENFGYGKDFAEKFYASEVYAHDPRVPFYRRVKPGEVYFDHALYNLDEMDRDPACRASYDALGVKYQLGAVVGLPDENTAALTVLSSEKQGHASEEAIAAYRRLAPHIQQAFSLGYIIEQRAATQAVLLEALARKADGVILLSHHCVPTFSNDAARKILGENDGVSYSAGSFIARTGPETRRLQDLIATAIQSTFGSSAKPGGQMLISRPSGKRPYVVRVMPAPPTERFLTGRSAACVLHLHDLAAERVPSKEMLCSTFGLSEREADLAIELVRCANLTAAAANAKMALNTARNHLQSIFRKSGTANQAEAVQLFSHL